jgi:hypothetical protein
MCLVQYLPLHAHTVHSRPRPVQELGSNRWMRARAPHRALVGVLPGSRQLCAVAQQRCKVLLDAHAYLLLAALAVAFRLNGPSAACRNSEQPP